MTWYRNFGTAELPVRQSLLNEYGSQYGCPKRFAFKLEEELSGGPPPRAKASWKPTLGTAIHETIARALRAAPEAICGGKLPARERVSRVLVEELGKAADGAPIDWYDANPDKELARATDMVLGGLRTLGERALSIVAVEAPFRVAIDGYVIDGTIDLLFEPRDEPGAIDLADWKSGQRKLDAIVRDYGYQGGAYGAAVRDGELWPGTEQAVRLGKAPRAIWIVQLYDLVPYEKPKRKADIGKPRGPAWYRSKRRPDDLDRLRVSLRTVIGTVRMGRFPESLGEQCSRCPYRAQCLGEGSGPDKSELRDVERALAGIEDLDELIPKVA